MSVLPASSAARLALMLNMIRRLAPFISLMLLATLLTSAQNAASDLLSRINSLRREKGLPAYVIHSALTAAASSHAAWMINSGAISHTQDNGSGPRERAQNHGYPSNWVSENIYMGASAQTAWAFWIHSPVHYAGLVSPYYNNIGIGTASGGGRHAFVLVFGNSLGRLPPSAADPPSSSAPAGQPSYVLGIDAVGNIMHQVRPGDNMGEIALIYGYTWQDIPYMLEINNMTSDMLEIGSVVLVPPQDGTFTPTAAPAAQSPTPSAPPPAAPTATLAPPSPAPTRGLVIRAIPTQTPPPASAPNEMLPPPAILIGAAFIQVGIIGAASFALIRRMR